MAYGFGQVTLYKNGAPTGTVVPTVSPVAGWSFNDTFYIDDQGRVIGTIKSGSMNQPVIYANGVWTSMLSLLPVGIPYTNLRPIRVSHDGIIVCLANPVGDSTHYVHVSLKAK